MLLSPTKPDVTNQLGVFLIGPRQSLTMFLNKILQVAIINQAVGIWMEDYCHPIPHAWGMCSFINLELDKPICLYAKNWSFS